jgi:hypothetical protein
MQALNMLFSKLVPDAGLTEQDTAETGWVRDGGASGAGAAQQVWQWISTRLAATAACGPRSVLPVAPQGACSALQP